MYLQNGKNQISKYKKIRLLIDKSAETTEPYSGEEILKKAIDKSNSQKKELENSKTKSDLMKKIMIILIKEQLENAEAIKKLFN
jgi:hypothetical protein